MLDQFLRTQLIFGRKSMEILAGSRVAVFGVGGVGSHAVEALARSGVGKLDIIDNDTVCVTNINRQVFATLKTIGKPKVEVARERIFSINPNCEVRTHQVFCAPGCNAGFDFKQFDYVVDAIDTVTGKLWLIMNANASKTPISPRQLTIKTTVRITDIVFFIVLLLLYHKNYTIYNNYSTFFRLSAHKIHGNILWHLNNRIILYYYLINPFNICRVKFRITALSSSETK